MKAFRRSRAVHVESVEALFCLSAAQVDAEKISAGMEAGWIA